MPVTVMNQRGYPQRAKVVEAAEAACVRAKGQTTHVMAASVVEAFFNAKLAQPQASRAHYSVASEVGREGVVARLTLRSQLALCDMLGTASDRRFDDLALVSSVLSTSMTRPVQALLASFASAEVVIRPGESGRNGDRLPASGRIYLTQGDNDAQTQRHRTTSRI